MSEKKEMDEKYVIADATTALDEYNNILNTRIAARKYGEMSTFHVNEITHMDVNLSQIFSLCFQKMRLKLYQSRKEENVKFKLKKEFDLSIEIYISFS